MTYLFINFTESNFINVLDDVDSRFGAEEEEGEDAQGARPRVHRAQRLERRLGHRAHVAQHLEQGGQLLPEALHWRRLPVWLEKPQEKF